MMPTLLPHLASAIARFTATVVLPTPPLPAPTAMTFFTPGSAARPASGPTASRTRALICTSTAVTPGQLHHGRARLIAHQILHRTRRRRQLDREGDAAAVDDEVLDEAQADDIAMKIRVLDDLQRLEHGRFVHLHILKNIVHSGNLTDAQAVQG